MFLLKRFSQTFSALKRSEKVALRGKIIQGKQAAALKWQKKLDRLVKAKAYKTVPEVEELRRYIYQNPVAQMYLQGGLDQIPNRICQVDEQGRVTDPQGRDAIGYNCTWQHLLDRFAVITSKAPQFQDVDIIGVPFYALVIDLLNTPFGRTFFAIPEVDRHLKKIFNVYSDFLWTPESREHMNDKPNGWFSPAAMARVNYQDYVGVYPDQPYFGFASWHHWFTREIKQSARPFDKDPNVIINNSEHYPNLGMPRTNVQWHDKFWLKDQRYSLAEMFGANNLSPSEQAYFRDFQGGIVYQGFLNPWCYHRWRAPVEGILEKSIRIGNSYYAGNPSLSLDLPESYIQSQPLLTMTSVRHIYIINTGIPNLGKVAVIQVGMAEVSGVIDKLEGRVGTKIHKGELMGMFQFGGSSHAFVFQRKAALAGLRFVEQAKNPIDQNGELIRLNVRSNLAFVGKGPR